MADRCISAFILVHRRLSCKIASRSTEPVEMKKIGSNSVFIGATYCFPIYTDKHRQSASVGPHGYARIRVTTAISQVSQVFVLRVRVRVSFTVRVRDRTPMFSIAPLKLHMSLNKILLMINAWC